MGGITIALDLHPLAVMTHFLLGLAVVAFSVIVVLEAWSLVGGLAGPAGSRWLRLVVTWIGLPVCAALVVTGAVATASGPHPGSSDDVERIGITITTPRPRAGGGRVRNQGAGARVLLWRLLSSGHRPALDHPARCPRRAGDTR
jgi:cytochrome c oxidase assembly protein subunit 15